MRPEFESGMTDRDTPWGSWRRYDGPNLTHTLNVMKSRDGDYWLEIGWWKATREDPGRAWNVRFRTPMVGGGNFEEGYWAVGGILAALKVLAQQQDSHQAELALLSPPVPEMDWQWRDADDAFGHIGVAITASGALMVALCPYSEPYDSSETCETVLAVFWPASTPPSLYAALAKFCQAVTADNLSSRGRYRGNHA